MVLENHPPRAFMGSCDKTRNTMINYGRRSLGRVCRLNQTSSGTWWSNLNQSKAHDLSARLRL